MSAATKSALKSNQTIEDWTWWLSPSMKRLALIQNYIISLAAYNRREFAGQAKSRIEMPNAILAKA